MKGYAVSDQEHSEQPVAMDLSAVNVNLSRARTTIILETEDIEVIEWVVPANHELPTHSSPGAVTMHCLSGSVELSMDDKVIPLKAGQLIYLPPHAMRSFRGIESSLLLLTQVNPTDEATSRVQEASEESFPASDSPAWTGVTGP